MTTQQIRVRMPVDIREEGIPLPSRDDGYATVMLVGTIGAGKTTVLRRLIGSDRFPSTSAARTTTADIEIITADGPFSAIITFMDPRECGDEIEKCLHNACRVAVTENSDSRIAGALLSPPEQRFRLSYLLGAWESERLETSSVQNQLGGLQAVSEEERDVNQERLQDYVDRIKTITRLVSEQTDTAGSTLAEARRSGERDAWMNLFGEMLLLDSGFQELVAEMLVEVRKRFDWVEEGTFGVSDDGWPMAWQFESEDWDTFLAQVIWFSGNHRGQFGRLLTPLVNGVRVRGPFMSGSNILGTNRKLVIIDGEGLGHTARSATSISSRITDRFPQVDLILLVDNAQQPLLAAPQELMKAAGSTGYADKLAFAFTHFENVIGDDLYTVEDREERVRNPGRDAVDTMRGVVGDDVAEDLLDRVEEYAFFLESMDKPTNQLPIHSVGELRRLLDTIEDAAHPEDEPAGKIRLSSRDLDMAISDAVARFHEPWQGWLGIKRHPDYPKEHWTRVKALSLRVIMGLDGYDTLLPVDDLRSRLQEAVSRWLDRQTASFDDGVTPEERLTALRVIRQRVHGRLQDIAGERIARRNPAGWERAYQHSGSGSSYRRADDIDTIYRRAVPDIGFDKSADAQELLNLVYAGIQAAAEEVDCRLD